MIISEIFRSIQGESSFAGRPCTFVRTAGCSLRCFYCDTGYALTTSDGMEMSIDSIFQNVLELGSDLVEITGGEPLEEPDTPALCERLLANQSTVLVETGGHCGIARLPREAIKILDIKTPGSRMEKRNRWENIALLSPQDEIKFVLCDHEDFIWAVEICKKYTLFDNHAVHFSPVCETLPPADLAEWLLREKIPARLQLQLHKILWPSIERGV